MVQQIKISPLGILSKHFTHAEFFRHYINDEIPVTYYNNALALANLLEQVRDVFNTPLFINSCYRDEQRNKLAGGVSNSQHLTASAVDFRPVNLVDFDRVFNACKVFPFGQLIRYDSFIHISLMRPDKPNKMIIDKRSK